MIDGTQPSETGLERTRRGDENSRVIHSSWVFTTTEQVKPVQTRAEWGPRTYAYEHWCVGHKLGDKTLVGEDTTVEEVSLPRPAGAQNRADSETSTVQRDPRAPPPTGGEENPGTGKPSHGNS